MSDSEEEEEEEEVGTDSEVALNYEGMCPQSTSVYDLKLLVYETLRGQCLFTNWTPRSRVFHIWITSVATRFTLSLDVLLGSETSPPVSGILGDSATVNGKVVRQPPIWLGAGEPGLNSSLFD